MQKGVLFASAQERWSLLKESLRPAVLLTTLVRVLHIGSIKLLLLIQYLVLRLHLIAKSVHILVNLVRPCNEFVVLSIGSVDSIGSVRAELGLRRRSFVKSEVFLLVARVALRAVSVDGRLHRHASARHRPARLAPQVVVEVLYRHLLRCASH